MKSPRRPGTLTEKETNVTDELEPGPSKAEMMAREMDELAELIEQIPELARLSAEDFDRAVHELDMIEHAF